ncbi:uncharacterized protein [Eurosta solidaginis]|uniref:uncharacterized protein n=1 Tax=Eurosta solidaginis TaxID=178769 RepID=UPI0035307387
MRHLKFFLMSCFVAAAFLFTRVSAKCNTCSLNGIACLTEQSFHICHRTRSDASQIFNCPEGHVCVADAPEKCVPNAVADCAVEHNICGACDGSKLFTCLTPTTFAQCNGTSLLRHISGSCPNVLTCDSSRPEICVANGAECS